MQRVLFDPFLLLLPLPPGLVAAARIPSPSLNPISGFPAEYSLVGNVGTGLGVVGVALGTMTIPILLVGFLVWVSGLMGRTWRG
ncbi:hypothetical protein F4778DRAFT_717978 [Xylariomycetidae sp. FL2044]|nr:hypothetical protein F4778DRAFT_717978 [Xylariomycetidae sp. FL2044]